MIECNCRTLTIGNKKYPLQPLIGCPFGSLFQVENGKEGQYLSRIVPTAEGLIHDVCFRFVLLLVPCYDLL